MTPHNNQTALEAEIAKLRAENLALRQGGPKTSNGLKVTSKGGVSLYGLGRFPVTLYASQWLNLLESRDNILAFIELNKAQLAVKPVVVNAVAKAV